MKHPLMLAVALLAVLCFVGCERTITGDVVEDDADQTVGCFDCHGDDDELSLRAISAQFESSIHGSGNNTNRNRLNNTRYAGCEKCHTSEGFIAEVTGVPADGDHFTSFDCFTCHAPHTDGDFGVRGAAAATLENGTVYDRGMSNLCANCHMSRRDVTTTVVAGVELSGHWGPHHSNQADMLIGANAYEFAGYDYDNSWHATGVTDGCVECHMSSAVHQTIGGHSWNMKNDDRGFENITGCNVDGCHSADPVGSVDRENVGDLNGDGTTEGVQTELHHLLDSLGGLLVSAGLLEDGHPVADLVVSTADSAGALYNFLFVEEDRSFGVHNTDYAYDLLISSINFLNTGDPNGVAGQAQGPDRVTRRPKVAMLTSH